MKNIFLSMCCLAIWSIPSLAIELERPISLEANIEFWKKIYREYDSHQIVYFDELNPNLVYYVMDLPKIENEISGPKFKGAVDKKFQEISGALGEISSGLVLGQKSDLRRTIERAISRAGVKISDDLVSRLRYQNGLKSQFALGLSLSGRYAEEMKAVLKSQGLSERLLAIVFVESLFYLNAHSYAGAAGPWGIVKDTALISGIHVNNFTDERIDPVVATFGAAKYLSKAKEGLKKWSLAITSYNYGYPGMLRASKNLETDKIEVIIREHDSPIFGFASKNYYAEFLAALDTYENRDQYFPEVKVREPWTYDLVQVLRPVEVSDLLAVGAIDLKSLRELNPSLTSRTISGQEVIPPDYALRVPKGKAKHFYDRLKKIPSQKRSKAAYKISEKYHASGEETLYRIAQKNGLSPDFLADKMGKPLVYKPKGAINIRSQGFMFSQLVDLVKEVAAIFKPKKVVDKSAQ